jgi:hypothetical protein
MGTIVKPAVRDAWGDDAMTSADMVDPGNSAVSTGWPLSTTPPSRQRFNWLLNYCMNAVRYFCRRGIADYDAAETYVVNDVTRGPDNILYASLVAGNIGNTPATSPTKWALLPYVTPAQLSSAVAPLATSAAVTADVLALDNAIALLAPKASPALTGNPTTPTPTLGDNDTSIANTAFIARALAALVQSGTFTCAAGTVPVPFGYTFASVPRVFVQWNYGSPDTGWVVPGSITTTGFSYQNGNGGLCDWFATTA